MAKDASQHIDLTVVNHATGQKSIYIGQMAQLDFSLGNYTGGGITFKAGGSASTFEIYLPPFFKPNDLNGMSIKLADWEFTVDQDEQSLLLTYSGAGEKIWPDGGVFAFSLVGVQSSEKKPSTDNIQVNISNMKGEHLPPQVQAPLSLLEPPQPHNASLEDVLQVSLENQGSVFVSSRNDPLRNSLFLNLKNLGTAALYSGAAMWAGSPMVIVSFVYGDTSGALAFDRKSEAPTTGSAWKIQGAIHVDQTSGWSITNPDPAGQAPHPQWVLHPVNTNKEIIGTDAHANVSFEFSDIISFTPTGHTQMTLHFTGFRKDEQTAYDDYVLTLDIVKQEPPPTRGLLNFFATSDPIVRVTRPNQSFKIQLKWAMFDVTKINLITGLPNTPAHSRTYPSPAPLAYDGHQLELPGISQSTPVFMTLQAFDGNGGYLNSLQFTVFIDARMFTDKDGKVYPAVLIKNKLWMAQNLDYKAPEGSFFYNDDTGNENRYGRLYSWRAAQQSIPQGWRLPSRRDWQELLDNYGPSEAAYKALIVGGASGFDARLGGWRSEAGNYSDNEKIGYYWTSSEENPENIYYTTFSAKREMLILSNAYPPSSGLSVRYVRDI
jgi:uncharacterized protein (TIGR02145 family)